MKTENETNPTAGSGRPDEEPGSAHFRVVFWDPDEKAERTADFQATDLPEAIRKASHHYNYPRRVFLAPNGQSAGSAAKNSTDTQDGQS